MVNTSPAETGILVLARHPRVVAAAMAAARIVSGHQPRLFTHGGVALRHLCGPGLPPRRVLLEPAAAGGAWGALLAILDDPSLTDTLIFVAADGMGAPDGVTMLPAEAALLAAALRLPPRRARRSPPTSIRALTMGLDRDALLLRYQPVIRIADRRMVLVEALARWRGRPMMHGPESFVPAVERAGLARPLALAVIAGAAQDIGSLACHWGIGVSVNLSLEQLQRQDMGFWISQALKAGGLPAKNLSIELTETTPVHDLSLLRRALRRMAAAGHAVFLDDLAIDDGRLGLQSLGFAGVKLDKSLVERLPEDARARRFVQHVVRQANRCGQVVTAEGVADARLWAAVAALGVHRAQGYWVGRALPAAMLRIWQRRWAALA